MSNAVSDIGKALYSLINSTVAIYPTVAPQNTSGTYAVYDTIRVEPDMVKQEVSWADDATVFIIVYAETRVLAQTAAKSIRTILDQYEGTAGTVYINSAYFVDQNTEWDNDLKKYITITEYLIRTLNT